MTRLGIALIFLMIGFQAGCRETQPVSPVCAPLYYCPPPCPPVCAPAVSNPCTPSMSRPAVPQSVMPQPALPR